ncbi:hypothetical protein KIPB_007093 [Kipferlia bialata]|uniref:Uncharacterized protein n=1 Tax=Kipferlia bialata TaxID=797122 RepID=A0A9K3D189_9EUKA|nr:hypothetical protein KIPB_007093 [Kipferlia bialata]|eukprot:g7093.t1
MSFPRSNQSQMQPGQYMPNQPQMQGYPPQQMHQQQFPAGMGHPGQQFSPQPYMFPSPMMSFPPQLSMQLQHVMQVTQALTGRLDTLKLQVKELEEKRGDLEEGLADAQYTLSCETARREGLQAFVESQAEEIAQLQNALDEQRNRRVRAAMAEGLTSQEEGACQIVECNRKAAVMPEVVLPECIGALPSESEDPDGEGAVEDAFSYPTLSLNPQDGLLRPFDNVSQPQAQAPVVVTMPDSPVTYALPVPDTDAQTPEETEEVSTPVQSEAVSAEASEEEEQEKEEETPAPAPAKATAKRAPKAEEGAEAAKGKRNNRRNKNRNKKAKTPTAKAPLPLPVPAAQ